MVERGRRYRNGTKLPKVLPELQWVKAARKEHKRERVDEDGEERRIRGQIAQEVVAGIKEKVSVRDGVKNDVKRPVEQCFMQSWDCSQFENEEEVESWREGDQMAAQWDEEQKWRRLWNEEGWKEAPCSWKLCKMQLSYVCTGWSMTKMKKT